MTNALDLVAPVDTLAMEFTREFDAPVDALFRAHADPELVKQWLGPHGLEMQITEWEFKSHGGLRTAGGFVGWLRPNGIVGPLWEYLDSGSSICSGWSVLVGHYWPSVW